MPHPMHIVGKKRILWWGTIYNILINYIEWTLHEITKFKKLETA